jgi:hypothetical protein
MIRMPRSLSSHHKIRLESLGYDWISTGSLVTEDTAWFYGHVEQQTGIRQSMYGY